MCKISIYVQDFNQRSILSVVIPRSEHDEGPAVPLRSQVRQTLKSVPSLPDSIASSLTQRIRAGLNYGAPPELDFPSVTISEKSAIIAKPLFRLSRSAKRFLLMPSSGAMTSTLSKN
jgi:hypothetical protein